MNYNGHVISLTEFSSTTNPKQRVIVEFSHFSAVVWRFDAFSERKRRFSKSPGVRPKRTWKIHERSYNFQTRGKDNKMDYTIATVEIKCTVSFKEGNSEAKSKS